MDFERKLIGFGTYLKQGNPETATVDGSIPFRLFDKLGSDWGTESAEGSRHGAAGSATGNIT